MSGRFGSGNYQFELVKGWGDSWPVEGVASDVATDSNGKVYIAVRTSQTEERKTCVMLVLNRDGSFHSQWGEEHFSTPHGLWINSVMKYSMPTQAIILSLSSVPQGN